MKNIIFVAYTLFLIAPNSLMAETLNVKFTDHIESNEAAILVGINLLKNVYGEEAIEQQMPFDAKHIDNKWVVRGTFYCDSPKDLSPDKHWACSGGVAEIILYENGSVESLSHGE